MKWVLLYSYYFIIIIPLLVDSREYPRETAARECSEETLGVLGDSRYLLLMLEDYKTNNVFKVRV